MEGIRRIAKAYYERASEEEKNKAKAFFKKLDADGDGIITLQEFKASVRSCYNDEKLFKQLDANGSWTLDFDEALALYYISEKTSIHKCDGAGCRDLLMGPYFSCLPCHSVENTFDLCCDCYSRGKFKHKHDLTNFFDNHDLLWKYTKRQEKKGMEELREIARAYYDTSEEEKNKVNAFFKKIDADGDGTITLEEFKASVKPWYNDEKIFRQLDANGNGTLDSDEALALYYMSEKTLIPKCDVCRDLLMGPYFSCLPCQAKFPETFDLCCDCYRGGKFKHEHELSSFLDHHALLRMYERKTGMTELREIAQSHYRAGSPEVQALAFEFFNSLDADGDGQVDITEFLSFMRQEGYVNMRNPHFFKELDRDGNGTLDFWEVMTLYYIIKSGRPFCDGCGNFIPGLFFSCVECYMKGSDGSFSLCHDCYQSDKCKHNHTQFLDNYTLLEAHRDSKLAQATGVNQIMFTNQTYVQNQSNSSPMPSYSTAIVPANKTNQTKSAFRALELGLQIGTVSAAICSIL